MKPALSVRKIGYFEEIEVEYNLFIINFIIYCLVGNNTLLIKGTFTITTANPMLIATASK